MGRQIKTDQTERKLRNIQMEEQIAISGGLTSKKFVLDTEVLEFPDGKQLSSTIIGKQETWLCQMVTNIGVWNRPLQRVRIFNELAMKLNSLKTESMKLESKQANGDAKMAALGWDDDDADLIASEHSHEAWTRPKNNRKQSSVVTEIPDGETFTRVLKFKCLPDDATEQEVYIGFHKKKLWLACRSIPWLICYLHREVQLGGVEPIAVEPKIGSFIRWNFRHGAWQARAKDPAGVWQTLSKTISTRQNAEGDACFGMDFVTTRKVIRQEMEQWVRDVENGLIAAGDV